MKKDELKPTGLDQDIVENQLNAILKSAHWAALEAAIIRQSPEKLIRAKTLLAHITNLAGRESIPLSMQPTQVQQIIFNGIWSNLVSDEISTQLVESLYAPVRDWLNGATKINQASMGAPGNLSSKPLHRCSTTEWMTDAHITLLMPTDSSGYIALSPFNIRDNASLTSLSEAVSVYLALPEIRVISIPVGPEHWRHVTLAKGRFNKLHVEINDSFGAHSARRIQSDVIRLLKAAGLSDKDFDIKFVEPKIRQTDGYACGDFTVAYAHCIAKQAGSTQVDQAIINTLSKQGNTKGALSQVMRQTSAERCNDRTQDFSIPSTKRASPVGEIEMSEIKQSKKLRDNTSAHVLATRKSPSLFSEGSTDSSGTDSDPGVSLDDTHPHSTS